MKHHKRLFLISIFIITLPLTLSAEDYHNHHLAIFLGATKCTYERGPNSPTIGLDYEFYLNHTFPEFGLGLMTEFILAEHIEYNAALPFYYHPSGSFKFWLAPGVIERKELSTDGADETHDYFLLRIGGDYDMHFGNYTVSPTLSADFVDSEILVVYGVTFGLVF